jgi:hypothetical protein
MRALVVYESMYGNTAAVAEAISEALREHGVDATAGPVTAIDPEDAAAVELVVVGGPTHVHGMSRSSTRRAAADDEANTYPAPTREPGLREWLDDVPRGDGRQAAAFDTRIDKPALVTGSAAKGIGRRLEQRGFRLAVRPESFFVTSQNELTPGALERAAAFGTALARAGAGAGATAARVTAASGS